MKVVISGGCGFLGQCLCRLILRKGSLTGPGNKLQPVTEIVLADIGKPVNL